MQGWWECTRCAGMVGVYEMCRDGGSLRDVQGWWEVRCAGMVSVWACA